jgi:hypothetical protein
MEDLLSYMLAYGVYAATVGLLFVLLFIEEPRGRRMRLAVAALGLLAFALPALLLSESLGYPDPWPDNGKFRLLGWQVEEGDQAIYLFVDEDKAAPPRQLRVPFLRDPALALQKAEQNIGIFSSMTVEVAEGPRRAEPLYELRFVKVFGDE